MSQTFFTSDHHFGHANVLTHCARPYSSIEEHDEDLVARWNAVVRRQDTVWHLGDFAFRCHPQQVARIFRRLNGSKHLILGNHDKLSELAGLGWASPPSHLRDITVDKQRIVLCHYGMRTWAGIFNGAIHLYGHSHGNLPGTTKSQDVGVDVFDFYPVTLEQIRAKMAGNAPYLGEPANPVDA